MKVQIHPQAFAILYRRYNCSSDLSCEMYHQRRQALNQHSNLCFSVRKHRRHYIERPQRKEAHPSNSRYNFPTRHLQHPEEYMGAVFVAMDDESLHQYHCRQCRRDMISSVQYCQYSIAKRLTRCARVYMRSGHDSSYRDRAPFVRRHHQSPDLRDWQSQSQCIR